MDLSRRQFFQAAAAGAAVVPSFGAATPSKLPTRTLGRPASRSRYSDSAREADS